MIDCHCHLVDNSFKKDVDEVVARAIQSGVTSCVVVLEFPDQAEKVISLMERHRGVVWPSLGVHPIQKRNRCVQMKHVDAVLPLIEKYADTIVCVGEIGLDHSSHYKLTEDDKKIQVEVFMRQLQLAERLNLPVNVHSRSSASATLSVLSSYSCSVLLHAFDGDSGQIDEAVSRGYFLSIAPSFTISPQGQRIVSRTPLTQLVLESDSPALGVEKGRNEPSFLCLSAQFIAREKGVSVDEIIQQTTKNAVQLFTRISLS